MDGTVILPPLVFRELSGVSLRRHDTEHTDTQDNCRALLCCAISTVIMLSVVPMLLRQRQPFCLVLLGLRQLRIDWQLIGTTCLPLLCLSSYVTIHHFLVAPQSNAKPYYFYSTDYYIILNPINESVVSKNLKKCER